MGGFLEYLREQQPVIWRTLLESEQKGLLVIDEEADAISATSRLLLTNDILQQNLKLLSDDWATEVCSSDDHFRHILKGNTSS